MITVVTLLALGVVAARVPSLPAGTPKALDWLVIWLALPGLILDRVPTLELDAETLVPVGVAWGTLALLAAAVLVISRIRGWSRRITGTLLLVVPLGNTSFLGFPAIEALLGSSHIPHAVIYDQLGSFLALATWGTFVAARYGAGASPTVASTLRRVVTFPPFVALVVALLLRSIALPADVDEVVTEVTRTLGDMLTPLTMLAVGMRLRIPTTWHRIEPAGIGLALKMVAAPAAAYGVAMALGADGIAWEASILESAMPPMVTASIVAIAAGLDEEVASSMVGLGVLAAMVTLPIVATVVG